VAVLWKPRVEVDGIPPWLVGDNWAAMMYFSLCSGQAGSTVLSGLCPAPVDEGWLVGCHWRQRVEGAVRGIRVDFGFEIGGAGAPRELSPLRAGVPWRLEAGPCVVTLFFGGGFIGATPAEPLVIRQEGEARWRISLLRAENATLDWSAPLPVGLAWLLDISPRGRAPAVEDFTWSVRGTRLSIAATVDGRRLALRYNPPGITNLTARAVEFDG